METQTFDFFSTFLDYKADLNFDLFPINNRRQKEPFKEVNSACILYNRNTQRVTQMGTVIF